MHIVFHRDAAAFADVPGPWLTGDPARHTVVLTVLDQLVRGGQPAALLVTAHEYTGAVVAVAPQTPDRPVMLTARPPARPGFARPLPDAEAVRGPLPRVG